MKHSIKKPSCSYYLIAISICCILFVLLTVVVKFYNTHLDLNLYFYQFAKKLKTPFLSYLSIVISLLGDKYVIIPTITMTSLILYFQQQKRLALHFFIMIILTATLVYLLKHAIAFPRPGVFNLPTKYAFPSGHVSLCSAYLMFLSTIIIPNIRRKWLGILIIGLIILVESISRMILEVHWFTDIVGGFLLGTACGLMGAYSYYLKPVSVSNFPALLKCLTKVFCVISIVYLLIYWKALCNAYQIK